MMKAIRTRYLGPTNYRGSRIKADDGDGNTITVGYPHDKGPGAEAHAVAAVALCRKMGWAGELVSGGLNDCYVFTFSESERFAVSVTDADRAAVEARHVARMAEILAR